MEKIIIMLDSELKQLHTLGAADQLAAYAVRGTGMV